MCSSSHLLLTVILQQKSIWFSLEKGTDFLLLPVQNLKIVCLKPTYHYCTHTLTATIWTNTIAVHNCIILAFRAWDKQLFSNCILSHKTKSLHSPHLMCLKMQKCSNKKELQTMCIVRKRRRNRIQGDGCCLFASTKVTFVVTISRAVNDGIDLF